MQRFGSIDAVVNNAGIFIAKPFIEYTADDFRALVSTNLEGYIYVTQLAVKQMLAQKSGGSIVAITAALVQNPIYGSPASVSMITKGGLNAITLSLASEYAKEHIRFNAVAPGVVATPLVKTLQRMPSRRYLQWVQSPPGRDRKRGGLSHRIAPDHRGGAARGRRCAQRQMVAPTNPQPAGAEQRLQDLGIVLPNPPHPLGAYVEAVQSGNLLFLSGTLPIKDGKPQYIGRTRQGTRCGCGPRCTADRNLNALCHRQGASRLTRSRHQSRPRRSLLAKSGDFNDLPTVADAASSFSETYLAKTRCPCGLSWGSRLAARRSRDTRGDLRS